MQTTESTPNSTQYPALEEPVIIYDGWGRYEVYPANVAYAKKLLVDEMAKLPVDCVSGLKAMNSRKAFKDSPQDLTVPYVVPDALFRKAIKDLTTSDLGSLSGALYRLSTPTPVPDQELSTTKALRDELVLWAFEHKLDLKTANYDDFNRLQPQNTLSFLTGLAARANGHPVLFISEDDNDASHELSTLLYGTWKETARVENVVSRYLEVLNSLLHRDAKYRLGTYYPASE